MAKARYHSVEMTIPPLRLPKHGGTPTPGRTHQPHTSDKGTKHPMQNEGLLLGKDNCTNPPTTQKAAPDKDPEVLGQTPTSSHYSSVHGRETNLKGLN